MSIVLPFRSQYLTPPPTRASSYNNDPLPYIKRQAKYIERNIQVLIDAQSDGLMAGLGRPHQADTPSDTSHTPTPSEPGSPQCSSAGPVKQTPGKKIGLRAAREGIFKCMRDLLELREEERETLAFRMTERRDALAEIDGFNSKAAGLEDAISKIQDSDENQRSRSLQEEARNLEADIRDLETKLYEMKAKHRHIVNEISQVGNSVDAKLSSYKTSLSILQSNIQKYLQSPPLEPLSLTTKEATFYSLQPKRRTLEMAQEHWNAEQAELQTRQAEVDSEIAALEEGGGMWKSVIAEVSGFEKRLKTEMRRSIQTKSQRINPDGPSGSKEDTSQAKAIIEDLENTAQRVEKQLGFAEDRHWNLLICCISAELEALREAREMLLNAFNVSEEELCPSHDREPAKKDDHAGNDSHEDSLTDPLSVDNPEPPADLLKDSNGNPHTHGARSDDEDDEPDPAWLLPES
ncbi:hypothetical protein PHISCL_03437 [Aspergillus sclerotialis]|uniref:Autophagy-related protein Atg28 n=1 Tax=Aspergillus sclerotialis TaxID=2070753 RepID=A0A3A2ZS54_9EURO|nr:hypothetical protein PHISCL_03437 [Aspergillus sclerotialis]